MKFWRASVYNLDTNKNETFILQAPFGETRILEILAEVHPEFETIVVAQIDRPSWIKKAFGDDG
jgi:hypothetical protein